MRETGRGGLMERVREALGVMPDLVIFRNQSGAVEVNGQWQRYGLTKGASDLIGLVKPSGRMFCCEVETPHVRKSKEHKESQLLFRKLINRFGGYACRARSVDEAERHYYAALRGEAAPDE